MCEFVAEHSHEPTADSELVKHLKSIIKFRGGPTSVAEYMEEVLINPKAGFYINRDVFGAEVPTIIIAHEFFYALPVHQFQVLVKTGSYLDTPMQQRELEANAREEAREREWRQKMNDINTMLRKFSDPRPLIS